MAIRRDLLRREIFNAIIKGIQRNGSRIFDTSQNTAACYVPRDTGNLARSGYVNNLDSGVEIGYLANYSAAVELGRPAEKIVGTQIIHVKRHRRKNKDGSVSIIEAHDKEYKNKRLIRFRPKFSKFERGEPIYRVISEIKAQEGQHYLGRAIKEELPKIVEDIGFYLKRLEAR